jgi:photosystem II stability/assembly factor-like uncharacterized protein
VSNLRSLIAVFGLAVVVVTALPSAAGAGIWAPATTGTPSAITAIEYQSDTRFWFTTADGAIFKRRADGTFTRELDPIGVAFNDIEFQPGDGLIGLAVGDGGKVYRSADAGENWAPVTGIPVSNVGDGSGNKCTDVVPLGDVHFVRFAGAGRVWIGAGARQLARSQPVSASNVGLAGTWFDANRKTVPVVGDNCYIESAAPFADMAISANPDVAYIAMGGFGDKAFYTTNNLSSEAPAKPAEIANGMTSIGTLAIDPANPNRLWAVCGGCPYGNSGAQYTEDGYGTSHRISLGSGDWDTSNGPWDVDLAGGTVLMAGNAGMILNSIDGRKFHKQPADADLTTQDWRSVGVADATRAAVGGTNGKLVLSTTANSVPVAVVPPPPPPPPPPLPPPPSPKYRGTSKAIKVSDKYASYSFSVPRDCVAPGQTFTATMKWSRKKRKGNVFVKVSRVDFYLGTKRLVIDRKPPFSYRYKLVATQRRGSTIQLRARAFTKVKRGKAPTKSLRATIKVC